MPNMPHIILCLLLLLVMFTMDLQAQESRNCPERYLEYGKAFLLEKDFFSAITNFEKEQLYFPNCRSAQDALYLTIKAYHEIIVENRQRHHIDAARTYAIRYSEVYDDSSQLADIQGWWTEIEAIEKEVTVSARDFWQLVSSVAILVGFLTVSGF